jgi:RimJ/RimL family protein N-acetyltransferase
VTRGIAFRRIRPEDREALLAIAAQIWEGHDYLPRVFDPWVADEKSYFAGLVLDGRLVGCGRLHPFDAKRGWLEGLRIEPGHQGQGLGYHMSRHVVEHACEAGLQELMFATYFRNLGSIRISERMGFRRGATFTNLELKDLDAAGRWAEGVDRARVTEADGLPPVPGYLSNDWFFIPPEVADRQRYLPGARTIREGEDLLVIAPNARYPQSLEICWMGTSGRDVRPGCLAQAVARAVALGFREMHTMVPADGSTQGFAAAGFAYQEEPYDVHLYSARVDDLRALLGAGGPPPGGAGPYGAGSEPAGG